MNYFFVVSCITILGCSTLQIQASDSLNKSLQLRLQELNSMILSQPDFDAYHERADLMYSFGDYSGAIRDYSEALTYKASDSRIFLKRAKAKDATGEIIGALVDLNTSISLDSTIMEAWHCRGNMKRTLADYVGAINDYTKAIALSADFAPAYNSRGLALMYSDDETALDDFNKAIELNPNFAEAYNNRADFLYMYNKENEACTDWAKSSELGNSKAKKSLSKLCDSVTGNDK